MEKVGDLSPPTPWDLSLYGLTLLFLMRPHKKVRPLIRQSPVSALWSLPSVAVSSGRTKTIIAHFDKIIRNSINYYDT
jgi:hypothetical protein